MIDFAPIYREFQQMIQNRNSLRVDLITSGLIIFIILASFFTFSYRFFPLLNSDMAINILMTPDYHLPGDLYAWGQDRGGTLIPLLSHILYRLIPISPVSAVSIVHYSILILGFMAASSLLKDRNGKLLLAIIWFFPPFHFTDFVLFPFGTQFSLFFVSIWFFHKSELQKRWYFSHTLLAVACISGIISVWVSELGILMIILFLFQLFLPGIINSEKRIKTERIVPIIFQIGIWIIVGTFFILYAKSKAVRIDIYSNQPFNSPELILESLKIMGKTLIHMFTFSAGNWAESIYSWLVLLSIPVMIGFTTSRNSGWYSKVNRKWFWFFILNAFLMLLTAIASHWVFLNGVGRRYFVLVYISVGFVILLLTETITGKLRRWINSLLLLIVIGGAFSAVYPFWYPKYRPSRIKVLSELKSLGDIGIIAEYWNAYLSATPDPVHIKATPHDKDYVRNYQLAEEVFRQPNLYLIKDMWLDSFPDTIRQFGRTLVKNGNMFHMADAWLCSYETFRNRWVFGPGELKYQGNFTDDPASGNGKSISISTNASYDKNRHFVYGPYCKLNKGEYKVSFLIRMTGSKPVEPVVDLDVSTGYGKFILITKRIYPADLQEGTKFSSIDLPFTISEFNDGVEFRIFYLGNGDLFLEKIILLEK